MRRARHPRRRPPQRNPRAPDAVGSPPWRRKSGLARPLHAVVFLVLGLLYLVTFYLSAGQLPLPIGDWNLAAGFGLMLVGGGMLMFWK